jgi:large subunit ribosomal protein L25
MDFFISAELRKKIGKNNNFKLRKEKKVPAIIYSSGLSIPIFFSYFYVSDIIKHLNLGNKLFYINVGNDKYFTLLKSYYKHPVKEDILHFDFQRVDLDDIVVANVFFNFIGEKSAIGIRHGGFLIKHKLSLNIKCLVSKMPNFIDVDVSNLDVNKSLFLSDLNIPDFIVFSNFNKRNKSDILIASILGSRVLEQKVQQDLKNK